MLLKPLLLTLLIAYGAAYEHNGNLLKRFLSEEISLVDLQREIADLKTRLDMLTHGPVAFKAHMTKSVSPGANEHIIFDDVQLNLGGAFHEHTSVFIAPYNGTYLFSVSVCSSAGHFIVLDLMRTTTVIGRILAGDSAYDDCSSETTVTVLTAGDEVYVQHRNNVGDYIHIQQNTINSFTGVLLQQT